MNQSVTLSIATGIISTIVATVLAAIMDVQHISPIIILESIGVGLGCGLLTWYLWFRLDRHQRRRQYEETYQMEKELEDRQTFMALQEALHSATFSVGALFASSARLKRHFGLTEVDDIVESMLPGLRRLDILYPDPHPEYESTIYGDSWLIFLEKLQPLAVRGDISAARNLWPLYKGPSIWRRIRTRSLHALRRMRRSNLP